MAKTPTFLPATFRADKESQRVIASIQAGDSSLNLHFVSPEHILQFTSSLVDCAAEIWPDHPLIKMYMEDE